MIKGTAREKNNFNEGELGMILHTACKHSLSAERPEERK